MQKRRTRKKAMRAGWQTAVIPIDTRDPADSLEMDIDERLEQIQKDAWSTGYFLKVKSVTVSGVQPQQAGGAGLYAIILYKLKDDPSFRPPM